MGFVVLNCDASLTNHDESIDCGGLTRDENGVLILTFAQKLDTHSSFDAKIWSIYHEMCVLWGKGYRKIIVRDDNKQAIELLQGVFPDSHALGHLLRGIHDVVSGSNNLIWQYVNQNNNRPPDILAKHSLNAPSPYDIFLYASSFLRQALVAEGCNSFLPVN